MIRLPFVNRFLLICDREQGNSFRKQQVRPEPFQQFTFWLYLDCLEKLRSDALLQHPADSTLVTATPRTTTAASFSCLVAVPAKHRTIAARFKGNSCRLPGADHRCSMGWSRTIPGASPTLFALLCLTARLAALGGRITAFLKERLICSGKRKILSAIAARKLNISGHGCPLSMSSSRLYIRLGNFYIRIFLNVGKLTVHIQSI